MTQRRQTVLEPRHLLAIIQLDDLSRAMEISQALLAGGITTLEFPLTNLQAFQALRQTKQALGNRVQVGAGTVLLPENALAAIEAGASFLATPLFLPEVVAVGNRNNVPVICGAFTPTEIFNARKSGAELVKVFPAGNLGPTYIKDILTPLPDLHLVPTGGINLDNCAAFIKAGAYTVAIGSSLVNKELVQQADWNGLTNLARQFVQACTEG